jgi:hypothetical protein
MLRDAPQHTAPLNHQSEKATPLRLSYIGGVTGSVFGGSAGRWAGKTAGKKIGKLVGSAFSSSSTSTSLKSGFGSDDNVGTGRHAVYQEQQQQQQQQREEEQQDEQQQDRISGSSSSSSSSSSNSNSNYAFHRYNYTVGAARCPDRRVHIYLLAEITRGSFVQGGKVCRITPDEGLSVTQGRRDVDPQDLVNSNFAGLSLDAFASSSSSSSSSSSGGSGSSGSSGSGSGSGPRGSNERSSWKWSPVRDEVSEGLELPSNLNPSDDCVYSLRIDLEVVRKEEERPGDLRESERGLIRTPPLPRWVVEDSKFTPPFLLQLPAPSTRAFPTWW